MYTIKVKFNLIKSYIFISILILAWFIDTIAHTNFKYVENNETLGNNISFITISGMLLYSLGNYECFLQKKRNWSEFIIVKILSIIIFEKIGDISWMHNNLATSDNWSYKATVLYSVTLVSIFLILLKLCYYAHFYNQLKLFLCGLFIPIIIIITSFVYKIVYNNVNYRVHIHHWWLAYCLGFFTRFPNRFSRFFAAVFTGVYIEGLVVYKNSFIIENTGN